MYANARPLFERTLAEIREAGLEKRERLITTPQGAEIEATPPGQLDAPTREVLNFCANNYLGLASHPAGLRAAHAAIERHGYGMASVRFICGTQAPHKALEAALSRFFGTEDTILYSSCFDANGGLFETITTEDDAIISDALNHASIIDGIRLSKAERLRYPNGDLAALEAHLQATQGKRLRLIATDGVFSMDGCYAKLDAIADLADRYGALLMVDDSHATGFVGPTGRGTPELFGVAARVDVMTSTLGKALGGAAGGFTTGKKEIIDLLRNRSRPYLFSNTLPPPIAATSLAVLGLLDASAEPRERLWANTRRFRAGMTEAGFTLLPGDHPIVPIMLGDARLAAEFADAMLAEGVYVVGFSFPVVPKGQARIRVQLSAAHAPEHVEAAIAAFTKVGKRLGVVR
jgi:glycine C-acetyltransferase